MNGKQNPGAGGTGVPKVSADDELNLPNKSPAKSPAAKRLPNPTVAAVILLLAERWPAAFAIHEKRRRPLKIGIHLEIISALDGAITRVELSRALGCYVANDVYLSRLRVGAKRLGLDGAAAGEVTQAEADHAKMQLWMAAVQRQRERP